jgi:hypothetical protein
VGWGRGRSLLPFLGSASCCASSNALNIQTGDAVLAVDIGGTNIRAGVVQLNLKKSNTLAKAVSRSLHRRVARANISRLSRTGHCSAGLDVKRPDRRGQSKKHLKLAPFVGIGLVKSHSCRTSHDGVFLTIGTGLGNGRFTNRKD